MTKQRITRTEDIEKRLAEERAKRKSILKVEIEGVTIYADSEEEIQEIIERTDRIRKIYEKALEEREDLIEVLGGTKRNIAEILKEVKEEKSNFHLGAKVLSIAGLKVVVRTPEQKARFFAELKLFGVYVDRHPALVLLSKCSEWLDDEISLKCFGGLLEILAFAYNAGQEWSSFRKKVNPGREWDG